MKPTRVVLFASGAALVVVGVVFALLELSVGELAGLVLWLGAAVVVHDGIIVPGFAFLGQVLRRRAVAVPSSVLVAVESGFAVGALVTALVIPELVAQRLGPRNPTVVPGDYLAALAALWLGILTVVAVVAGIIVWRRRRSVRRGEPSPPTSRELPSTPER